MTLNLTRSRQPQELRPRIVVFGVGGAGCNAVNNMIRLNLEGVECAVANTDAQALALCVAERKIQLGLSITQGLGAGSRPEIGRAAAEEAWDEISAQIQGAHMVFITAGMGGGTGTGAAPVVARAAREQGLLTVGVVTKPFHFEGAHRMRLAEAGLQELQEVVDTLIVIPNQNLFRVANEKTTFADAFHMADTVLYSGVRGITDLMVMPGLINLDFADIRTVMSEMGKAMMGSGEAEGANRAIEAAERAISNPLLDDTSMAGARGLLINITGGPDLTLFEVDEAANRVRDEVDPQANIIFGSAFDESLKGRVRVSVFATGIDRQIVEKPKSEPQRPAAPRPAPVRMPIDAEKPVEPMYRPAAEHRPTPPAPQPALAPAPVAVAPPLAPRARPSVAEVVAAAAPTAQTEAPVPRRALRDSPVPRPPARAEAPRPEPARAEPEYEAVPPAAVAQSVTDAYAEPVAEQPDMFAPTAVEPPRQPAERPRGPQPAPRFEFRHQPEAARPRVIAHVDDIDPQRSSPEHTIRTGEMRNADPQRDPPSRTQRPSIFNLWRGRRGEGEAPRAAPEAPTVRSRQAEAVAPTPLRPAQPQVESAPRAAAPTIENQARRTKEDDVLEIPAFLRRQAN
jgi:cell division protein FtsZ